MDINSDNKFSKKLQTWLQVSTSKNMMSKSNLINSFIDLFFF